MKHLHLFESFDSFEKYSTLYRWCGQPGLFMYFYGDMSGEKMRPYLFADAVMPKQLPQLNLKISGSHFDSEEPNGMVCMTVDPNYIGEPYNGEAIIRLNLDFKKMYNELDKSKFIDLTFNGEAEIRYAGDIDDWPKYLIKIDILEDQYNDVYEDDFGEWRPISEWIPEEFKKYVKTFSDERELIVRNNQFDKNKMRK